MPLITAPSMVREDDRGTAGPDAPCSRTPKTSGTRALGDASTIWPRRIWIHVVGNPLVRVGNACYAVVRPLVVDCLTGPGLSMALAVGCEARSALVVPAGGVLVDLFDELSWGHSCYKRLSAVSLAAGSDRRGSRWDLWTASASFLVGVGTGATVLLTGPARLEPIMFPREAAASPATLTTLSAATTVISHSPPYSPWPRTTSCPLWA